jgi:uncharacterized protein YkwD
MARLPAVRLFARWARPAAIAGLALVASLLALAWAASGGQAGPNCAPSAGLDGEELAFFEQINGYRQDNGLQPLTLSDRLTRASAWKSQHMAEENYFAHDDTPINRTWVERIRDCGYTYNTWLGENIAAGNQGASATFNQWRNSPGHNANMLNADFNAIGIGRAYDSTSTYGWYWTTNFGGYSDGAPPTPTPSPHPSATPTLTATRTATPLPTTPGPSPTPGPATPTRTATPVLPPGSTVDADGDADCSGTTTSIDAALILQLISGVISAVPCIDAADVNGDNAISSVDAALVLQFAAGLIPGLPV